MQVGIVGLGRMGANIARRLLRKGHHPVVFDRDAAVVQALVAEGATGTSSLQDLVSRLAARRTVWAMLPAGEATESAILALRDMLSAGDTIIDGGNTFWKDDLRRATTLARHGIHYLDVGTSGGVWGLERGYCLMVGGEREEFARLEPIFAALAPAGEPPATHPVDDMDRARCGYIHAGTHGSGHFAKMIHNGIEYGLMQAYAEGFDILANAAHPRLDPAHRLELDVAAIAEVWRHGSVITSWLLDLTAEAFAKDASLDAYSGHVEDSGEGRWALLAAIEEAVPAETLSSALFARFRSRVEHTFAEKVLSAMRQGFGGHVEPRSPKEP
ncbi:MAG: decarboxylating 6-phosphogluconate dehydrogenase [Betaproteobacteria bacterium]|nr:decarboxylating 6-phosphogluconate dehydrogenase [Betaproteobacteria bacterium]